MRRAVVGKHIAQMIRDCRLSREGIVRALSGLHGDLAQHYERFRALRHPDDDRFFLFFDAVIDGKTRHTFTFFIDDMTSADHLIVVGFEHTARPTS